MLLSEFLRALRNVARHYDWRIDMHGIIKARTRGGDWSTKCSHCPITAVFNFNRPRDTWLSPAAADIAADRLGIPNDVAGAIMVSADWERNSPLYDDNLRADILEITHAYRTGWRYT